MQYLNRNLLLICLLIIILTTGAILSDKFSKASPINKTNIFQASSSAEVRSPNLYTNTTYGFSLEYPFNLQVKEASATSIIIGTVNDLETNSEVEIKIADITIKNTATESGEIILAKSLCEGNTQNSNIRCNKAINETSEIATTGSTLKTFYLEEVIKDKETNEILSTQLKGPFIATILKKNRTTQTILLIYPPLDRDAHLVNTQLIRDTVSSIKMIKY